MAKEQGKALVTVEGAECGFKKTRTMIPNYPLIW
jgi:hypothetical protein